MKIGRDAFLYLAPKGRDADFAQCPDCVFLAKPGLCALHGKDVKIKPSISCGLFVRGDPATLGQMHLVKLVTPKESGLVDRKVRCENCRYYNANRSTCQLYERLNKLMPQTFDLDTKVEAQACCNANME